MEGTPGVSVGRGAQQYPDERTTTAWRRAAAHANFIRAMVAPV
jgi:hypothetical protein